MATQQNPTIDELVCAFRSGNSTAGEILITRFEGLITKYYKLLTRGEYNPIDDDICRFITMFGKTSLSQTAGILQLRLKQFPREDIRQECVVAFLETIIQSTFISGAYKFKLKTRVEALLRQSMPEINIPVTITAEDLIGEFCPTVAPELDCEATEIDEEWIEGSTANRFSALTSEERRLVKLIWHDKVGDEAAAKVLGVSLSTLRRRKKAIMETLATVLRIPRGNS